MKKTVQKLKKLFDVTSEIQRLIAEDDWENAVEKLSLRQSMLAELGPAELQKISEVAKKSEKKSQSDSMTNLIRSIIEVEESNKKAVDASVRRAASSLVNLTLEKQKLRDLRAIAHVDQKQIVDFIY